MDSLNFYFTKLVLLGETANVPARVNPHLPLWALQLYFVFLFPRLKWPDDKKIVAILVNVSSEVVFHIPKPVRKYKFGKLVWSSYFAFPVLVIALIFT